MEKVAKSYAFLLLCQDHHKQMTITWTDKTPGDHFGVENAPRETATAGKHLLQW